MRKIGFFVAVSISACTVGGSPPVECSSNFDCGPGGTCSEGACMMPSEPPAPPAIPPPSPPVMTVPEAAAALFGRWEIVERRGLPIFGDADADGIELDLFRLWHNLGRNVHGELIDSSDARDAWHVDEYELGRMSINRGHDIVPLRYELPAGPDRLVLEAEDESGALTLERVGRGAVGCEKLPPPPTPFVHPLCEYQPGSCQCPNHVNGVATCRADAAVDCICGDAALDDLRAGMIGVWRGMRTTAGKPSREIYLRFDGRTYAPLCTGCECAAIDWGQDWGEYNWIEYNVYEIMPDGTGRGDMSVYVSVYSGDGASMENIRLAGDQLSFDLVRWGELPASTFVLERVTTAVHPAVPYCGDAPAGCNPGNSSCCSLGEGRPTVCMTCAD